MDQDHREYLEDRGSHQLEVEAMERERRRFHAVEIGGVDGRAEFHHDDGFMFITLRQSGQKVATFSMDHDIAIRFANSILSEVEIAQRGDTE